MFDTGHERSLLGEVPEPALKMMALTRLFSRCIPYIAVVSKVHIGRAVIYPSFGLMQRQGRFQTPDEMNVYNRRVLNALQSVSGVSHAASVTGMPLRGTSDGMSFTLVGGRTYSDPSQQPNTGFQSVSPDYFRTFGIEVLQGRSFTEQNSATSVRVAIVNQEFANRYLKGMDPFKQRVSISEIIPGQTRLGPQVEWQIVGIFHNVRYGDFRDDSPEVDVPFAQSLAPDVTIGVRTAEDPEATAKTITAAVHLVDPQIALANMRTMEQVKDESLTEIDSRCVCLSALRRWRCCLLELAFMG